MNNFHQRASRESKRFRREADAIKSDAKRLDEILYGAIWAIEHYADTAGQPTAVPGIRAVPTRTWPDAPALLVYYRYDEEFADLLSVRIADDPDDEETPEGEET